MALSLSNVLAVALVACCWILVLVAFAYLLYG